MATKSLLLVLISQLSGRRTAGCHEKGSRDPSHERYIVEVDGLAKSEYQIFVEALKASLRLKQAFPNSRIKLRDCYEKLPLRTH
jgi:hypothetical protein